MKRGRKPTVRGAKAPQALFGDKITEDEFLTLAKTVADYNLYHQREKEQMQVGNTATTAAGIGSPINKSLGLGPAQASPYKSRLAEHYMSLRELRQNISNFQNYIDPKGESTSDSPDTPPPSDFTSLLQGIENYTSSCDAMIQELLRRF